MKLIVGLGNPGERYKDTRHSAGFLVIEKLQLNVYSDFPWKFENKFNAAVCMAGEAILAKPLSFMNSSGGVVSSLVNFYKIPKNNLYVIHDDLDIKLGEYKIQFAVGPKLHNGIASIEDRLGTKDFWRIRMGVDNRGLENRISGEEYVLEDFNKEEREIFNAGAIKAIADLQTQ